MRKLAPVCLLVLAPLVPAGLTWAAVGGDAGKAASVKVAKCHQSANPASRYAIFRGRMRTADAKERMQMRFAVFEKSDNSWADVTPPEVKLWNQGRPEAQVFIFRQRIDRLGAPSSYRAKVEFRWLRDNRVTATATRTSGVCRTREYKPDLVAERLDLDPERDQGSARYVLTVRNAGKVAATNFLATITANGAPVGSTTVARLDPGKSTKLTATAPLCAAGSVVGEVDADNRVAESDETNNRREAACPATG